MSKLRKVDGLFYDLDLPDINKSLKYRAMKVKETKILLTAIEMHDENATVNAILDIVEAATKASFNVRELPMYLIDLIFLKIYIKSSGTQSMGVFKCGGTVHVPATEEAEAHDEPCGTQVNVAIDLESAGLIKDPDFKEKTVIDVGDGQSIVLRAPSLEKFKKIKFEVDEQARYVYASIESIVDGDDIRVPGQDFELEELTEWMDELDGQVLARITDFFKKIPQLGLDVKVTCPKCGRKEEFELKGLEDFFV